MPIVPGQHQNAHDDVDDIQPHNPLPAWVEQVQLNNLSHTARPGSSGQWRGRSKRSKLLASLVSSHPRTLLTQFRTSSHCHVLYWNFSWYVNIFALSLAVLQTPRQLNIAKVTSCFVPGHGIFIPCQIILSETKEVAWCCSLMKVIAVSGRSRKSFQCSLMKVIAVSGRSRKSFQSIHPTLTHSVFIVHV